jgi:hypothetical protein
MLKHWPEPEEQGRELVQSRRKPTGVIVIDALMPLGKSFARNVVRTVLANRREALRAFGAKPRAELECGSGLSKQFPDLYFHLLKAARIVANKDATHEASLVDEKERWQRGNTICM